MENDSVFKVGDKLIAIDFSGNSGMSLKNQIDKQVYNEFIVLGLEKIYVILFELPKNKFYYHRFIKYSPVMAALLTTDK